MAAAPPCPPNSDNSAFAAAPPLAATASANGQSSANRLTSTKGGDWLRTSWVANEGVVIEHFPAEGVRLAARSVDPSRERIGVWGYDPSIDRNPSPGASRRPPPDGRG